MNDKTETSARWPWIAAGALGAGLLWRGLTRTNRQPLPGAEDQPATAFITGASSGIGAAYARQLGARGYDLIITARREEKLAALADEIRTAYGVSVTVVPADLSLPDDIRRLEALLREQPALDFVINNAGFGVRGTVGDTDIEKQTAMINVHVTSIYRLTHAAVPGMIARGRGAIINVSSIAGFMANPGAVNYSATKAYINTFTEALAAELRPHGIQVQALCPGFTYSEFHDTPEYEEFERSAFPEFMWATAEDVVADSLAALGSGPVLFVPGLANKALALSTRSRAARTVIGVARQWFK